MISKELKDLALKSIDEDDSYDLILPIRKKIWLEMGPLLRDDSSYSIHGIGLYRRASLSMILGEKALTIWQNELPTAEGPMVMLDYADKYLKKQIDLDTCEEKYYAFESALYSTEDIKDFRTIYAGRASNAALFTAIYDEHRLELDDSGSIIDPSFLDDDYDEGWDTWYYAAAAFSYAIGEEQFIHEARLKFSQWYVNVAIPEAYKRADQYMR